MSASPVRAHPTTVTPAATPGVMLAMDTATEQVHLALVTEGGGLVRSLPGGPQASAALLPALAALLAEAGRAWSDVGAVGCGVGPGAFTGLRTACAVAQGLALGLNCPTLALDTLMAVAEDARQRRAADPAHPPLAEGDTVWVLQDARMGELYVASYAWRQGAWAPASPPALWSRDEPPRRWGDAPAASLMLVGNALAVYGADWAAWLDRAAGWQDPAAQPSGAALATLARQAWARGDALDAALLLPRYVRDKVAQTTEERQRAREAGG